METVNSTHSHSLADVVILADPPVSGQPSSDCCCGHEGSGFSCSATPCTISVPQQTDTLCVFLPYAEDWPEEVEAEVETDEPAVDIQPFDETTFTIDTTESKCTLCACTNVEEYIPCLSTYIKYLKHKSNPNPSIFLPLCREMYFFGKASILFQ